MASLRMALEGFEKQPDDSESMEETMALPPREKEMTAGDKGKRSLSRREFFFGLSALAARGLVPISSYAAEGEVERPPPKTERLKDEYQEGIDMLRDESLMSPYERLALYPQVKGGGSRWRFEPPQGVSHSTLPTPEEILQIFSEGVEHIEIAHTHPLALVYRDPEILSRARKGEAPLLAMPPSFLDISGAMLTIAPLERELSDRIAWKVVDPAGTWSYAIDRDNPYFKKISGAIQETIRLSTGLGTRKDMQLFVEKYGLRDIDPRTVLEMLVEKQKELSPASRALLQKILDIGKSLDDPLTAKIAEIERLRAGFSVDAPELKELRDAYARMGVSLRFVVHGARAR